MTSRPCLTSAGRTALLAALRRVVLCGCLVSSALACSRPSATKEQQTKRPAEMVFPVEVRRVLPRRVEYRVTAVGSVEAFENVQVTARVAGVLEALHFKEGDEVKAGALLAEIEPQRYQLAVSSSQAVLQRAEAAKAEAARELDRAQKLAAEGLSTGAEVSTWQTKLATATAEEGSAKAALSVAQLNLRDARMRAPQSGSIQTRSVQTGQYVQPGSVIATLIRREPLLLRFKVTEAEAGRLALGMLANFHVSGNSQKYQAKLTFIAGAAEPATRMVPVVGEIAAGAALRPGAFTEVIVPIGENAAALAVPETAIRPTERGFTAFVIDGANARERIVELGLRTPDGSVEVVKGLAVGDSLVIRGGEALKEGVKVKVLAEKTGASSAPAPSGPAPAASVSSP